MSQAYFPEQAPFSADQQAWLNGFMAGLAAAKADESAAQATVKPLHILYGTQTGNAEAVAEDAAAVATAKGWSPHIVEMDAVEMDALAAMEDVLVIISTYGEGDMPDNAHIFWQALTASTAPRLEHMRYGVFALGDSSYEHFCQAGKLIDTRFEQLGAVRLTARMDTDLDYEDHVEAWLEGAIALNEATANLAPAAKGPEKSIWNRKTPYPALMLENRLLSGEGSAKEIRHLAFDLGDSGLTYAAGDALGVMPMNDPALVQLLCDRLGVTADHLVSDQPIAALLTSSYEIMTPSRDLIRALEPLAKNDELSHVVSHGDKEALETFLWGRDTLDLLNLNAKLALDPALFLSWLKPLQHRAYSIASSPKAHPGEVHLTVAAVRWKATGREHKGVCSTFLADHVPQGASAGIFMSPNKSFRVPENDAVPMIMVGPGTGIAPFRAFLQERRERGASGPNWLFFGDQTCKDDFIYQDELSDLSASGVLSRLDLAFSRDQQEKIYVQHRMLENGADLYAHLEEGAHFYVCGDATRMAKDVDAALHQVIQDFGGKSEDQAVAYVNALKKTKRYVRDVY